MSYGISLSLSDLPSLSMIISRSINVAAKTIISFLLWLSSIPFLEKAMAPHSGTLAWKIPQMEEPGRLQSMELLRVGHDWATSLWLFTFMPWRRKWQPTPVFLPGESQRWGSLVGCRLWVGTELHRVGHDWSDLAAAAVFHSMYVPHLLYPFTY